MTSGRCLHGQPRDTFDRHRMLIQPPRFSVVRRAEQHRHALTDTGAVRQLDTPSEQESDRALVRRVAARDEPALATLYDRYAAQVHGLALAILRDPALAEEVTHDVFLRVWEQPGAYDPTRGTFAGWLFRVARNRAIDQLRRRRETTMGNLETSPEFWIADPEPTPEEQALLGQRRLEVVSALATLPADQRRLLEMAYYTGLSQREIAERLERPLGTVKSQIRSAMRRLADRLAADDPSLTERT